MSAPEPFTAEQIAFLRQMMAEEVEIAVAAGVGDTRRLLDGIPLIRAEMALQALPGETRKEQLVRANEDASNRVNEEHGVQRWLDGLRSDIEEQLRRGSA
ncbi:hypothetical protein [Croceibacterium aestuarii]|uniref:hypothetical protein n=1 Tax=Croceibacterium aestuarii TaxID=3064139 RepID=UPI00272DE75F|nr:hypothetical protein [Croceibacterium sp. D39]